MTLLLKFTLDWLDEMELNSFAPAILFDAELLGFELEVESELHPMKISRNEINRNKGIALTVVVFLVPRKL